MQLMKNINLLHVSTQFCHPEGVIQIKLNKAQSVPWIGHDRFLQNHSKFIFSQIILKIPRLEMWVILGSS